MSTQGVRVQIAGHWVGVNTFSDAQYYWRNGYRLQIGGMTYNKHDDMDMSRRHIETLFHKRIYG